MTPQGHSQIGQYQAYVPPKASKADIQLPSAPAPPVQGPPVPQAQPPQQPYQPYSPPSALQRHLLSRFSNLTSLRHRPRRPHPSRDRGRTSKPLRSRQFSHTSRPPSLSRCLTITAPTRRPLSSLQALRRRSRRPHNNTSHISSHTSLRHRDRRNLTDRSLGDRRRVE